MRTNTIPVTTVEWGATKPAGCQCGSHAEMAVALERAGAAYGAYSQAWRSCKALRFFFKFLVLAVIPALVVLWMFSNHADARASTDRTAAADRDDRIAALEARVASLSAPPGVTPAGATTAVPPRGGGPGRPNVGAPRPGRNPGADADGCA